MSDTTELMRRIEALEAENKRLRHFLSRIESCDYDEWADHADVLLSELKFWQEKAVDLLEENSQDFDKS